MDRLADLIDRLSAKTESGELRWSEWLRGNAYQISFPDYSVIVEGPANRFAAVLPSYSLRVLDGRGQVAVSVISREIGRALLDDPDAVDPAALRRLHTAAQRSVSVTREKVLDDLLKQVG